MLEGVSGERGVVNLYVHLEVLVETVSFQEAYYGFRVHVVLVLRRLHGLRLYEERARKAIGAGIVACHGQHACQMVLLALLVGVEQAHVALATSPEYVVGAAKLDGSVNGVLYLYGSACHYIKVGIGCRSVHIALMSEDVCRAPQQVLVGMLSQLLLEVVGDNAHALLVFLYGAALLNEVRVVEAEEVYAELVHYLKACVGFVFGTLHRVSGIVPGVMSCLAAKLVARGLAKRVPPCKGEAQPVFHLLAGYYLLCIVVVECQWIFTLCSLEGNLADLWEILFHSCVFL